VLARRDTTQHAVVRRIPRGEKAGLPRSPAHTRYHSLTDTALTDTALGKGATLEHGLRGRFRIRRIAVR